MNIILRHAAWMVAVLGAAPPFATFAQAPGQIFGADNRVPMKDARVGRLIPVGCTGWLISNGAFLTAGHCAAANGPDTDCSKGVKQTFEKIEFNVRPSSQNGTIQPSSSADQYLIDRATLQCEFIKLSDTTVKDWAVFSVKLNSQGQSAAERQKSFFRAVDLNEFVLAKSTTNLRVTGNGVDGPPPGYGEKGTPRNQYSQTEQTATGEFLGVFTSFDFWNLRYVVDTTEGNSGSPVIVNGTGLTLGIHDGAGSGYNYATSFQLPSLASALHGLPGRLLTPAIPGDRIYYVDDASPYFTANPDGNLFSPFPTLTAALNRIAKVTAATMISVVTGHYPETIDETTGQTVGITVSLKADATLVLPVGDVTLWDQEDAADLSRP